MVQKICAEYREAHVCDGENPVIRFSSCLDGDLELLEGGYAGSVGGSNVRSFLSWVGNLVARNSDLQAPARYCLPFF